VRLEGDALAHRRRERAAVGDEERSAVAERGEVRVAERLLGRVSDGKVGTGQAELAREALPEGRDIGDWERHLRDARLAAAGRRPRDSCRGHPRC
jgi:hypothetical protein